MIRVAWCVYSRVFFRSRLLAFSCGIYVFPILRRIVVVLQVTEYLKRQKDPDQLATLLQMLQCLLNNPHFAFLEIYVSDACLSLYWMISRKWSLFCSICRVQLFGSCSSAGCQPDFCCSFVRGTAPFGMCSESLMYARIPSVRCRKKPPT